MIPKFRAWDKLNKGMCDVANIDFMTKVVELRHDIPFYFLPFSEVVLMQSTGLKDRNGVEIFEGDILTWESPTMTQSTWIGIVFRNGAEFSVRKSKKTYSTGAWLNSACRPTNNIITVIGDIYQNKELLEAVK